MQSFTELIQIADRLNAQGQLGLKPELNKLSDDLRNAARQVGKSHSGSWIGYHANVYYQNLSSPPPGAHFSQEWGLKELYSNRMGSRGDWLEYNSDEVKKKIHEMAGNPDLEPIKKVARECQELFEDDLSEVLSILSTELSKSNDDFLQTIKKEILELKTNIIDPSELLERWNPSRGAITRDATAVGQGLKPPPHQVILSDIVEIHNSIAAPIELSRLAKKAGLHLARKYRQNEKPSNQRVKSEKFGILDSPSLLSEDIRDAKGVLGVACIFLDIDDFKSLNTKYSNRVVDKFILPDFQDLIDSAVGNNGFAYAEGGDEISILLPNMTQKMAINFAEGLREAVLNKKFIIEKDEIQLKISVGISHLGANGDLSTLADNAGIAALKAKELGKNRTCIFSEDGSKEVT